MRRIQLVLAALAIVVTSFAAFAGPVMADDWHNWNDRWHNNNWHNWNNGEDDWENDWNGWNRWNGWNTGNDWNTGNGWNTWGEVQNCPFWGDTSGPVNQSDCFG